MLFFLVGCSFWLRVVLMFWYLCTIYAQGKKKKKKKLHCNLAKHGQGEANQGTNLHVEYGIFLSFFFFFFFFFFFVWWNMVCSMCCSLSLVIMGPTVKMNITLMNLTTDITRHFMWRHVAFHVAMRVRNRFAIQAIIPQTFLVTTKSFAWKYGIRFM